MKDSPRVLGASAAAAVRAPRKERSQPQSSGKYYSRMEFRELLQNDLSIGEVGRESW